MLCYSPWMIRPYTQTFWVDERDRERHAYARFTNGKELSNTIKGRLMLI